MCEIARWYDIRIIWLSAHRFGYNLLHEAVQLPIMEDGGAEISVIITLSSDAKTVMYDDLATEMWNDFGVDVYRIKNINEEEAFIRSLKPDMIIMCGWRQIVDKKILDIPKYGVVAFHPTLLPIGRGSAPIINSIISGFKESGVTIFYAAEGLDDGDIIGQEKFIIEDSDYASDVYDKVIVAGRKLISKYLPLLVSKSAPRIKQDNSKAVIFDKRNLADNKIDLSKESLEDAYRKIRALSKPYRGAYIEKDGKKLIIWKAELK